MLKDAHRGFAFYCLKANRQDFLSYNKCGQATKQQTKACMDEFIKDTNKINFLHEENKVPYICA